MTDFKSITNPLILEGLVIPPSTGIKPKDAVESKRFQDEMEKHRIKKGGDAEQNNKRAPEQESEGTRQLTKPTQDQPKTKSTSLYDIQMPTVKLPKKTTPPVPLTNFSSKRTALSAEDFENTPLDTEDDFSFNLEEAPSEFIQFQEEQGSILSNETSNLNSPVKEELLSTKIPKPALEVTPNKAESKPIPVVKKIPEDIVSEKIVPEKPLPTNSANNTSPILIKNPKEPFQEKKISTDTELTRDSSPKPSSAIQHSNNKLDDSVKTAADYLNKAPVFSAENTPSDNPIEILNKPHLNQAKALPPEKPLPNKIETPDQNSLTTQEATTTPLLKKPLVEAPIEPTIKPLPIEQSLDSSEKANKAPSFLQKLPALENPLTDQTFKNEKAVLPIAESIEIPVTKEIITETSSIEPSLLKNLPADKILTQEKEAPPVAESIESPVVDEASIENSSEENSLFDPSSTDKVLKKEKEAPFIETPLNEHLSNETNPLLKEHSTHLITETPVTEPLLVKQPAANNIDTPIENPEKGPKQSPIEQPEIRENKVDPLLEEIPSAKPLVLKQPLPIKPIEDDEDTLPSIKTPESSKNEQPTYSKEPLIERPVEQAKEVTPQKSTIEPSLHEDTSIGLENPVKSTKKIVPEENLDEDKQELQIKPKLAIESPLNSAEVTPEISPKIETLSPPRQSISISQEIAEETPLLQSNKIIQVPTKPLSPPPFQEPESNKIETKPTVEAEPLKDSPENTDFEPSAAVKQTEILPEKTQKPAVVIPQNPGRPNALQEAETIKQASAPVITPSVKSTKESKRLETVSSLDDEEGYSQEQSSLMAPVSQTDSLEKEGHEKQDDHEKEAEEDQSKTLPAPHFFSFTPVTAPSIHSPTSFTELPLQVLELFERMVGVITVMQGMKGKTETTLILNGPQFTSSIFFGSQITIEEFTSAPKVYNIKFSGSEEAVKLFVSHKKALEESFESEDFNFEVHQIEVSLFEEKSSKKTQNQEGESLL